jgi:hypothetical protein
VSRAQDALLNRKHATELGFGLRESGLVEQFDGGERFASQREGMFDAEAALHNGKGSTHFHLGFGVPILETQLLRALDLSGFQARRCLPPSWRSRAPAKSD